MEHIYSEFYNQKTKITELKPDVLGVVLHDDAENNNAKDYIAWLQQRMDNNELDKGWACAYVDKQTCYWFHPSSYVEWHCGDAFANTHYIGIERCQSKINGILSDKEFMENEEASFWIAALLLKKYQLPVNRETVKLHKMFFDTQCPARAWSIHLDNTTTNAENIKTLQDYFINKIKAHYTNIQENDTAVVG
ncbi:peptidoglycan recognition protein family protein [Staphylococcus shinii]|jgi:N-acetylmuramoyl-L-alanine amidase CwlA|uniref:peptidoglycan recognition protein family protein n=1 Tax=Staphylococcus shinii TaxID=2912228 RepID=UPI00057BE350|nr:N-acetylmuramoyl-L-alanine amidase [Staphylococcus shinii]MDW8565760.1 N-acetylmuramoyl-L-alanine amidase [Staphylococcus shinii]PKI10165.1 hypothetical protein CW747_03165 [Staphylococcus shinii]PKI15140.1 hypothetical protein CW743_03380 [Staphylococcus shinii]RIN06755.1 hypothetical protein BU101_10325 [Staphylococcus shinii]